ncbi:hypothetical protein [Chitinophaga barathri]|uniref:Uncharacterized protein n=1 Tax=Chitinophaga barathri TaxID=1647451 RepID=A0A3N4MDZ1_9BACT|nr:hypothetical protein [Chitinophaga barathri]RPD42114.1 hypothetical protein EG028_08190 [Chitinophaga barathri]
MIKKMIFLSCLLAAFLHGGAQERPYQTYSYSSISGLCGHTITLHKNGTYVYMSGCEANQYYNCGTWTTKRDTIHFQPADNKTIPVVQQVTATRVPGDSIYLTVLNKNDANVTQWISAAQWLPRIGVIYRLNEYDTAPVKSDIRKEGSFITLITLNRMFARSFDYPADTANHFVIKLHLSEDQIVTRGRWDNIPAFSLIKHRDSLKEVIPHPLAIKYVLEKK